MRTKTDRLLHGPSAMEVGFGAVLSVALGVMLAAAVFVLKPVKTVTELPKEVASDTVYFLEGSHNPAKARQIAAKARSFVQGESIELDEDEINALAALDAKPVKKSAPAPGDKIKIAEETVISAPLMSPGAPNIRIRDGVAQVAVPLTFNILGFERSVIVQTRGTFAKQGDVFVFVPEKTYLGSCPLHRVPPVRNWFIRRVWTAMNVPDNLVSSWDRLSDVTIEGSTLRLTMP